MSMKQGMMLFLLLATPAWAEPLTLPPQQRPEWLAREGIVMAGSWEPLYFRARRDGKDYTPTPEQRAAYQREHSPEMLARLKDLGINFVMIHCYKGAGLEAERESMADAVRFARLCHAKGLRVGTYVGSATLFWDLLFKEVPRAKDWVLLRPDGKPRTYYGRPYRYFWNRNHPDAAAYHRQIVGFAIQEIQADLIHCDNYYAGPGYDACSTERFRRYLGETFAAEELSSLGIAPLAGVRPPDDRSPGQWYGTALRDMPPSVDQSPDLLKHAWREFCCRSLADSYRELTGWARSLRSDILMECNPAGPQGWITPPVDHGRLLQSGEAFWDEGPHPHYEKGNLRSRIPTYKVARCMENMAFATVGTPLEMAESMAFNRDCLGCVCWFEGGKIVDRPASESLLRGDLRPFLRFFHQRRDLLRDAQVMADVAVLRSFPSQVFSGLRNAQLTNEVEQALIANRGSFQIIYDHQLAGASRYRALVLAGCVAMGDEQLRQIRRYVAAGGRLCVIGPVATHDAWNRPRPKPALDDLPASQVVRISAKNDALAAIRRACDNAPTVEVDGPHGLCAEFTQQLGRRLLHLVNYRGDQPARNVCVRLRLPLGGRAQSVNLASPEHADQPLPFREQGGIVTFTVPEVRVYEIAVVRLEERPAGPTSNGPARQSKSALRGGLGSNSSP